jgi:hypothetical protein
MLALVEALQASVNLGVLEYQVLVNFVYLAAQLTRARTAALLRPSAPHQVFQQATETNT